MHKQINQLVGAVLDLDTNHLVENLDTLEVRKNTAQFLGLMALLGVVMIVMQSMRLEVVSMAFVIIGFCWAGSYLAAATAVYLFKPSKVWCIRISLLIVLAEGIIAIVRWIAYRDPSPGGDTILGVLIGLTFGALMLPWTPRQTMGLSMLWIVGSGLALLFSEQPEGFSYFAAIFAYIVVTIPGMMISFFRSTRLQDQFELHFLQTQFNEVHEELQAAKNIHERGFPKPKSSGDIRFTYAYRPMSEIGGDSIFASIEQPGEPQSPVTLVLFDVTGHGLSAALTANRLQGELMRIMGEEPTSSPATILEKLDRYVCLTLADSAVLVTAVAIHADPGQGRVQVANAGHPSAILRTARGTIERIDSSMPVLGVGVGKRATPTIAEFAFNVGDSLIAYTDGVSEAEVARGEQYGIDGIEAVLESDWMEGSDRWPEKILNDVENKRAGSATDDILIVEIYRA